jgi:hypothetical protein
MEQVLQLAVVVFAALATGGLNGQLDRPWARNVSPLGLDLC